MITSLFPIIATADLARSLAFYRDVLGGSVAYEFAPDDGPPVYVGLDIGASHIGIGFDTTVQYAPRPGAISIWMYADDCDATVDAVRAAGWQVTAEPSDQPWGERVARVLDPDGNEVIIGQPAQRSSG
jgi:lactoylglutathione lyase